MQYLKFFIIFLLIFCQVTLLGVETRSVENRNLNEQLKNLKELAEPEHDSDDRDDSVLYSEDSRASEDTISGWIMNSHSVHEKVTGDVSTEMLLFLEFLVLCQHQQ